jgi:hypothetical protein
MDRKSAIQFVVVVKGVSQVKDIKFVLASVPAVLLLLLALANLGPAAVFAAPDDESPALCNRVFLPALTGGAAGGNASAVEAAPAAALAITANAECDGFPDFNGDGYADLVIGVPHKEVFNGIVDATDAGIVQVIYGSGAGLNAEEPAAALDDQVWHRLAGGVMPLPGDEYGSALAMGDFNNDGYDDLAVGIPGAAIDGQDGAGAVQLIYGSSRGLTADGIHEWSRGDAAVTGAPAANDGFGTALTAGDFDGDGYADLAIGIPYTEVNGDAAAGAVEILYGRSSGISPLGDELITQDIAGFVASPAEAADHFGFSLAAGDYNGDGVDDLAVGTPYEDNGVGFADAGSVQVFFGKRGSTAGNSGLVQLGAVVNPQHWRSDSDNVEGAMEPNDRFGFALAAADYNGDGYDDLAIGSPMETHGSGPGTILFGGAVHVIHGGATGLAATVAQPGRIWHQDSTDVSDQVEENEFFGFALAGADFNNDGYADLAIGVPGNKVFGVAIGTVQILYGTSIGVTQAGDDLIYDPGNPEASDLFGWAVSAGDYDGDGFADLAVGARHDEPVRVGASDTGSVFTFYSDSSGVAQAVNQNWYPGNNGMRGTPAANDHTGIALPGSPRR